MLGQSSGDLGDFNEGVSGLEAGSEIDGVVDGVEGVVEGDSGLVEGDGF